jgi:hypothetical protein
MPLRSQHRHLPNHLVGAKQYRLREPDAERLRRFQVDDHLELRWYLHGQVGRLCDRGGIARRRCVLASGSPTSSMTIGMVDVAFCAANAARRRRNRQQCRRKCRQHATARIIRAPLFTSVMKAGTQSLQSVGIDSAQWRFTSTSVRDLSRTVRTVDSRRPDRRDAARGVRLRRTPTRRQQKVRQRGDQHDRADHVPHEHEREQDAHVGLELDR